MKVVIDKPGRINAVQLHAEMIAAGIAIGPLGVGLPPVFVRDGDTFAVLVPAGTSETTVLEVVRRHRPEPEPTAAQIKRQQVRKLIESDDSPESVRLRAIIRVLYSSLVEVRTRQQEDRAELKRLARQLIDAGLPVQPVTLKIDENPNRSWEVVQQAVLDQIDSEIPNPVEVNP